MKKILFFDDCVLKRRSNLVRRFHDPEWLDDHLFIDDTTMSGAGYASIVPAPVDGYYMYYVAFPRESGKVPDFSSLLCMAESRDGLRWTKAVFEPPRDKRHPQVVWTGNPVPMGCCVYHDTYDGNPERRYKLTSINGMASPESGRPLGALLFSADGLNWRCDEEHPWIRRQSDTANNLLWNPRTGRYQMIVRRHLAERLVYCVESEDLETWSEPRLVLHPDSQDPAMMQFYGLRQFHYGDVFLGFLWRYETTDEGDPWKMMGVNETELVYSCDGRHWTRTHRPFMPRRAPGEYGGFGMMGTGLIERADCLLCYAVASLEEHHRILDRTPGSAPFSAILPGRLRKDGFVGLATKVGPGELATDLLFLRSSELHLNVKAPFGGVRVQISGPTCEPLPGYSFDECEEIRGDHISVSPRWKRWNDLAGAIQALPKEGYMAGRACIQVRLEQAELFSIAGDFGVGFTAGAPGEDGF